MQFTIQSKFNEQDKVVNRFTLDNLTSFKGTVIKLKLVYEYGRYAIKYLVEYENDTREWMYEYNLEELK